MAWIHVDDTDADNAAGALRGAGIAFDPVAMLFGGSTIEMLPVDGRLIVLHLDLPNPPGKWMETFAAEVRDAGGIGVIVTPTADAEVLSLGDADLTALGLKRDTPHE